MNGPSHPGAPTAFSVIISGFKPTAQVTLERCAALIAPSGGYEVLFVDNTRDGRHGPRVEAVRRSFSESGPVVRYVPVSSPGKAAAQNVAVRASRGRYIVCLDDDVLPDPELLREYERAFDAHPCAAVQGRVALLFEGVDRPPSWLDHRLRLDLAEMDFGKVIYPFTMGLTGANMAFRREAFDRYGLFDERLGPARTGTLEDQEFSERLQAAGETQLFWPAASVQHRIPPERLRVGSFARIHYDVGYSDYLLSHAMVKGGPAKFGVYTLRQCLGHIGHALAALAGRETGTAVYEYCELHRCYGYYRQYLRSRGRMRDGKAKHE